MGQWEPELIRNSAFPEPGLGLLNEMNFFLTMDIPPGFTDLDADIECHQHQFGYAGAL